MDMVRDDGNPSSSPPPPPRAEEDAQDRSDADANDDDADAADPPVPCRRTVSGTVVVVDAAGTAASADGGALGVLG
jgi:hypothetical protein